MHTRPTTPGSTATRPRAGQGSMAGRGPPRMGASSSAPSAPPPTPAAASLRTYTSTCGAVATRCNGPTSCSSPTTPSSAHTTGRTRGTRANSGTSPQSRTAPTARSTPRSIFASGPRRTTRPRNAVIRERRRDTDTFSGYWVTGLLGYWVTGLLGYWVAGPEVGDSRSHAPPAEQPCNPATQQPWNPATSEGIETKNDDRVRAPERELLQAARAGDRA